MDLSKIAVDGGVRQRNEQVTRLEPLIDAALASARRLLVMRFDVTRGLPGIAMSFLGIGHGRCIRVLAAQGDLRR